MQLREFNEGDIVHLHHGSDADWKIVRVFRREKMTHDGYRMHCYDFSTQDHCYLYDGRAGDCRKIGGPEEDVVYPDEVLVHPENFTGEQIAAAYVGLHGKEIRHAHWDEQAGVLVVNRVPEGRLDVVIGNGVVSLVFTNRRGEDLTMHFPGEVSAGHAGCKLDPLTIQGFARDLVEHFR